jgi:hypothetical protein
MRHVMVMVVVMMMVVMVMMVVMIWGRNLRQRGASRQNGGDGDGEQIFQHSYLLIHDGHIGPRQNDAEKRR